MSGHHPTTLLGVTPFMLASRFLGGPLLKPKVLLASVRRVPRPVSPCRGRMYGCMVDQDGIEPSLGLAEYGFTVRCNLSQYLPLIHYAKEKPHEHFAGLALGWTIR